MSIHIMRIFLKVHELGNLRMAADALGLTSSALTKALHRFENEKNCKLFLNSGKKMQLTPLGFSLLPYAERLVKSAQIMEDCLDRHTGREFAAVTINCSESFGAYYLPKALVLFSRRYPDIRLECTLCHNDDSLLATVEMRNDLSIVSNMAAHPDIEQIPLFTERLVFIVPNTEEYARVCSAEPWRLHGKPAIVHEKESFPRRAFEQYVRESGVNCPIRMELSNNEQIRQSVLAGLGVALVSAAVAADDVAAGRVRIVDPHHPAMERSYVIAMHRSRFHSPSVLTFVDELVEWGRGLHP